MTPTLSAWQEEALRKFQGRSEDFLLVACPGAGKTRFALAAARHQLDQRGTRNVIVVVPTRHLRHQWAATATAFGINLDSMFENGSGVVAADFHGIVVTYAAVASQPLLYARLASDRDTLVILDEVHHAGDAETWGNALRQAFEGAGRRLLLSGTPKRTDGKEVPFVRYDTAGAYVEDYLYDYGAALEDYRIGEDGQRLPVVRATDFSIQDGKARWVTAGEAEVRLNLSDANDITMANALRSALEPGGKWISSVLAEADAELTRKRQTMPDAGGLVVAADQFRARKYAGILEKLTGEQVSIAISDEPASSKTIDDFSDGRGRWIVAVAMVSEGVDIPRLAVGVYATQTRTELFFRQVVGRIVRSRGAGDVERATMFVPGVEPLVRYAAEIERTTRIALETKKTREMAERDQELPGNFSETVILGGETAVHAGTISHGEQYSADELALAETMIASNDFPPDTSPIVMAAFVRKLRGPAPESTPSVVPDVPLVQQKKQARTDLTQLVGKVAKHCYGSHKSAAEVRYDLRSLGYPKVNECSLDDIHEQIQILTRCLANHERVA